MHRIGVTLRVNDERERRDALDQAWYTVLASIDIVPVLLPNLPDPAAVARLANDVGIEGLLLTGGNDLAQVRGGSACAPERDAVEHALLELAETRGLPVLGVCRGMQHLVVHHGGTIAAVERHVAVRHTLTVRGPEPMPLTDRTEVNSFHDWGVPASGLPASLRTVGLAPDGTVEAVVHRELPHWGIMWHPERAPYDPRDRDILSQLFALRGKKVHA